jgi:perosamine synthetase
MIPVFSPLIEADEITNVVDALKRGEVSGNFGIYLDRFESEFAAYCGCKHGIATTSGTTALQLAVDAAGIRAGDEVLVSSSTNIATALGVLRNGAIPVPVDSENATWNLNLELIGALVTPRTKAIIPVHLFGHPVDMDDLMERAKRHNLIVIEDCAESHGATVRGRMTGSFGHMSCFSFYANKVITTGEGGMVVTDDDVLAERLRLLRNLGFTKPRFRHEVAGYNFRMTGFQAAIGLAQLHKIESVIERKRSIARAYTERLGRVRGLQLPVELNWARNVYWMYALRVLPEFGMTRDALAEKLQAAGIETRTFFCPMNQQPCLQELPGFRADPCPVADQIWQDGLYLPSGTTLTEDQISTVCHAIEHARG